jgi:hypothetical protein
LPTLGPILETLLKWSETVETPNEDEVEDEYEVEVQETTLIGMERLGQGLVAHLTRCPSERERIAKRTEIIDELERGATFSVGAMWVAEIFRKRSGLLLVIHAEERKGVWVQYENISNCFHLFSLLQRALVGIMPGAKEPSPEVLKALEGNLEENAWDGACWHYGQGTSATASLDASIWGEASPDSIERIDDNQVMLLWNPIMENRTWDRGFFGPRIMSAPAQVTVVNELTAEQLEGWWKRLKLAGK